MGSFLSSLFGGGNSTSQTTTNKPNAQVLSDYLAMLKQAQGLSSKAYPDYTPAEAAAAQAKYDPSLVAPMTPYQYQAMQGMSQLPGYSQPYMDTAAGLAALGASPIQMQQFSPGAVNQYLSPYLQNVMGSAVANINETNAQQQQQVLGNSIARGAFGGDRGSIAQSELARQQGLANNATLANIANTGYGQALGEFNNQQQQNMLAQLQSAQLANNASSQFANIGTQGQNAYLQGLQAMYGAGTAQQQQQQAQLSTAYQQYLNQQQYPYQQLNWYTGLLNGAATGMGGTTTASIPQPSLANQLIGGIGMIGSMGNGNNNYFSQGLSAIGNGISNAASSAGNWLSGLGFAEGGRVGFADGGAPSLDPSTAYSNYVALAQSGTATPDQLNAAYQAYILAETNYVPQNTTSAATTPTAATTPADTSKSQDNKQADTLPTYGRNGNGGNGGNGADYSSSSDTSSGGYGSTMGEASPGGYFSDMHGGFGPNVSGVVGNVIGSAIGSGLAGPLGGIIGGQIGKNYAGSGFAQSGYTVDPQTGLIKGTAAYDPTQAGATAPASSSDQFTALYGGGNNPISQAGNAGSGVITNTQNPFNGNVQAKYNSLSPDVAVQPNAATAGVPTADSLKLFSQIAQQESGVQQFDKNGNPMIDSVPGQNGEYAIGLSQIQPSTAAAAAAAAGIPFDATRLATDPNYNAAIGQAYTSQLVDKYNGNTTLAAAAYNAGEGNVAKVIAMFNGDLNAAAKYVSDRGYVKSVAGQPISQPVLQTFSQVSPALSGLQQGNIITRFGDTNLANQPIMTAPDYTGAKQNTSPDVSNPYGFAGNLNVNGLGDVGVTDNASGSGVFSGGQNSGPTMSAPPETGNGGFGSFGIGGIQSDTGGGNGGGGGNYNSPSESSGGPGHGASQDSGGGWGNYGSFGESSGYGGGSDTSGGDTGGGDGGGEKRGGLVTRHHHYDTGGVVVPDASTQQISLQYGMPTQADLKRFAQSIMGTGVAPRSGQAEALAASGVVPQAASGGRIHKQVAGPVVWSGGDMVPDQSEYPVGQDIIQNAPIYQPSVEVKPSGVISRSSGAYDPTMGSAPPEKQKLLDNSVSQEEPKRTEPVMPKVELAPPAPNTKEEDWTAAFAPEPEQKKKGVQVAQNVNPNVMSDAEPQGQIGVMRAEDPYRLAAFNAFARLAGTPGSFGVGLAAAADQYSKTLLAGQENQRKQFDTLAAARLREAEANQANVAAMMGRVDTKGLGTKVYTPGENGGIEISSGIVVPGQTTTLGGQASSQPVSTTLVGQGTEPNAPSLAFAGPAAGAADPQEALNKQAVAALAAQNDIMQAAVSPEIQATKYSNFDSEAQKVANAARANQNVLYNQIKAITALPESGGMQVGAGANIRYLAANYFNQLIPGLGATADNLSNAEVANKIATYSAQNVGNDAAAVWKGALSKAQPNVELQKATSNELMAAALVNQKREIDRGQFSNAYGQVTYNHGGSGNVVFDKVNPPALYQRDQAIFQDMMNNKGVPMQDMNDPKKQVTENPVTALLNGRWTPQEFDAWADGAYGSRYGIKNLHLSDYLR